MNDQEKEIQKYKEQGRGKKKKHQLAPEPEKYAAFCAFCEQAPQITAHHHVIGSYNAMLRFAVKDTNELDELLTRIKTYGDSRTSVELKTCFSEKELQLP